MGEGERMNLKEEIKIIRKKLSHYNQILTEQLHEEFLEKEDMNDGNKWRKK